MNDLQRHFKEHEATGPYLQKSWEFLDTYDKLLSKYRGKELVMVELGVAAGADIRMFKEYLGPGAVLFGIDLSTPKAVGDEQIKLIQGNQGDNVFLDSLKHILPEIDVLIDDCSHICSHQINTFERLFKQIKSGGLYVIEDTHTSYRAAYEGGYKKPGTFIEYCKDIIDSLHSQENDSIRNDTDRQQIESITFYRSMIVIKKR